MLRDLILQSRDLHSLNRDPPLPKKHVSSAAAGLNKNYVRFDQQEK